jgi:5-(carboxyamino)imidazole ribonucleotide mutase
MSAHRNPDQVHEFSAQARDKGFGVIIAGAGMAAHLAGAVKAKTTLPVIGVPLPGGISDGMDALLATVQMPKGVPVATVTVGQAGAINAAVLAAEILSLSDAEIADKLTAYKARGAKL